MLNNLKRYILCNIYAYAFQFHKHNSIYYVRISSSNKVSCFILSQKLHIFVRVCSKETLPIQSVLLCAISEAKMVTRMFFWISINWPFIASQIEKKVLLNRFEKFSLRCLKLFSSNAIYTS